MTAFVQPSVNIFFALLKAIRNVHYVHFQLHGSRSTNPSAGSELLPPSPGPHFMQLKTTLSGSKQPLPALSWAKEFGYISCQVPESNVLN